jgi:type 2 lantibiotic biosynthesis protein LanM
VTDVLAAAIAPQPTSAPPTLPPGWWTGGLNLAERLALPGTPVPTTGSEERASRRLARWREEHKLAESGQFERRLAAVGLTEAELKALLMESPDSLASRAPRPEWAELTEAVIGRMSETRQMPEPVGPAPVAWHAGLSVIVAPFTELGYERLACAVSADGLDELVDLDALRGGFASALGYNMLLLATRTLVLELNVLRVMERLTGETSQERFWSFVRHFSQRSALAELLVEYPVLARLLAQATGRAVDSWLELLRRFAADRQRIVAEVFGGADPGRLVEVATGRGDTHQRGRSVAVLRFDEGARLVYKPRALTAHVHFNKCLSWLNRQMPDLGLRTLAVLDRARYGWVEFAEHRPCADRAGVQRYYRRQGALLALLYALDGSDFHYENLIASGDQPVLVDLEALLHPELPVAVPEVMLEDPARAAHEASVSRVGLLPNLVFGEGGAALDMSGLGGDAGQRIPFKSVGWAEAGTDEMRLVREQQPFPGSQNRPRLGEEEPDPSDFAAVLLAGFRDTYDVISACHKSFAKAGGLLAQFGSDELRVVPRATRLYANLLTESTHPDVLRDALDRDRILDYLWVLSKDDNERERLLEHELRDLWAGDVPLFTTRPTTRDIWTSEGIRIRGVLRRAGLDRAGRKVREMGDQDRALQEWIIQASFASRLASAGMAREQIPAAALHVAAPQRLNMDDAVHPERALAAARIVGDRLVDTAHRDRERVGWLGLHFIDESQWTVQPLGFDLYGGYPGVALFLSQLARMTGEERYAEVAHRACSPMRRIADHVGDQPEGVVPCSVFSSVVGLAYTLVHAAANLGEPELLSIVEPLVAAAASGVADDPVFDIVSGSAGCLAAAVAIHRATGLTVARDVARACAERLLENATPQDRGVAWEPTMDASRPLTGFSHGAAGIGWALLRYANAAGETKYAEVGLDAFRYERARFHYGIGNWPDFRLNPGESAPPPDQTPTSMQAWCHGAPGIGLARADSGSTDSPEVAADLEMAIHSMRHAPSEANLSLCHGLLGNLELLTVAAPSTAERAARAAQALAVFEQRGPICGTPGGIPTPGLMVGLAGIGHGLLRLGFPERVPSVLLLQPPEPPR